MERYGLTFSPRPVSRRRVRTHELCGVWSQCRASRICVTGDGAGQSCTIMQCSPLRSVYISAALSGAMPPRCIVLRLYREGLKMGAHRTSFLLRAPCSMGLAAQSQQPRKEVHRITVVKDRTELLLSQWCMQDSSLHRIPQCLLQIS